MKNRIRILETSDVHGYIFSRSYADGTLENRGLSKISSLMNELKDENTIMIDNGDNLQGSPLMYYHFQQHPDEISPITKAMDAVGFDYFNIGNHDFNYGEEALIRHIVNLKAPCITSNAIFNGEPLGPSYVIREIGGKKIAIFGVVTQYIPNWEVPAHIKGFTFLDAYETAKKTVELIRALEKPDYVIGVYHGGFERSLTNGQPTEDLTGENEAYAMCRDIKGLDILLTGHQHRSLAGKLFDTVYTSTAANGAELACIDIYTDTGVIEPQIFKADGPDNPEIDAVAEEEEKECQAWLDSPLGTSKIDLSIPDENAARLRKSQVITFLNMVEKDATGADLCASALFLHAKGFSHDITMRELVSTYPFPNTLVVKKITGKILREYLEMDADFWSIRDEHIIVSPWHDFPTPTHYNYDMVDGIEYTIKVSNDVGERITSLTYNGEEVTDDMEFTLCINNYRAAGGGNFNMLKEAPIVKVVERPMVELIADWLKEHKVVDFEPVNNIQVIK